MAGSGMHQSQNMSLQQVLAPQLQQSLAILQAPMLELRNIIQQEIQTNPVIEEDITEPSIEDKQREMEDFKDEFEKLAKLDEEWRDYMSQSASYSGRTSDEEERRQFFFDSLVNEETLQQHLLDQLNMLDLNKEDRRNAELIVGNIDDIGFLQTTPEEMSMNTGILEADFRRMLDVVQAFHPVGVGALNLRDCLMIQLRRLGKENSLEYRMVEHYLPDLGKRRFPEIGRKLGISPEQVQKHANFIGTLDPRPGQIFTPDPNNYVLPDVNVEKISGEYAISLNGEQIPHLRISNTYKDLMSGDENGAEVKDYIREKSEAENFSSKAFIKDSKQFTILQRRLLNISMNS